ncbi:MAG TPA: type II toxin-antitoxin system RelE/ParE family toxin [Methylocystis sp.]
MTIAADNPHAAIRVVRAIGARIGQLAHHPRLGPRRPDIQPRARVLVEGPYLILFKTHPDTNNDLVDWVEIVRVVDGRRDLSNVI